MFDSHCPIGTLQVAACNYLPIARQILINKVMRSESSIAKVYVIFA